MLRLKKQSDQVDFVEQAVGEAGCVRFHGPTASGWPWTCVLFGPSDGQTGGIPEPHALQLGHEFTNVLHFEHPKKTLQLQVVFILSYAADMKDIQLNHLLLGACSSHVFHCLIDFRLIYPRLQLHHTADLPERYKWGIYKKQHLKGNSRLVQLLYLNLDLRLCILPSSISDQKCSHLFI